MTLEGLLGVYDQFRDLRDRDGDLLPRMRIESLQVRPARVRALPSEPSAGASELAQLIADFAPDSGWLCFQSEVMQVRGAVLPEPDRARGLLLSGELVDADGESLHIRQDGRGGWIATRFTPGVGERYLVDEHRLVVFEPDPDRRDRPGWLRYLRYWRLDPDHGIRQAAARFIGFDEGR